ncbi:MAG: DUF1292 domain-containing protein [Bacilli bacterium]
MGEKQTIIVLDQNGQEREAEILSNFKLPDTGKEYIFYTFNEKDENDMVRLYASILTERDGMLSFENIESEEEWATIKEIMKKMAQI